MAFKEALKFEKENMPDFQWKFEKFVLAFVAVFLGGAILAIGASLLIDLVSGEKGALWCIPIVVWGCVALGMLIPLVIMSKKVKRQLVRYHSDKLLQEFYDTDYSEARQKMFDSEKITEEGFVISSEDETNVTIPFDKVSIIFNPRFWGGKLFLEIVLIDKSGGVFIDYLDNSYYNFLIRHIHLIRNEPIFELFDKDKERFVKMLLRYNNAQKIERKLQLV